MKRQGDPPGTMACLDRMVCRSIQMQGTWPMDRMAFLSPVPTPAFYCQERPFSDFTRYPYTEPCLSCPCPESQAVILRLAKATPCILQKRLLTRSTSKVLVTKPRAGSSWDIPVDLQNAPIVTIPITSQKWSLFTLLFPTWKENSQNSARTTLLPERR